MPPSPKRILFVEQNRDGTVGGSHKIMFDLVTRLSDEYEPLVLFYQDNIWVGRFRERGVEVHTWDDVLEKEDGATQGGKLSLLSGILGAVRTRRRFIREHGVDAVQLNNAPYVGGDVWIPAAWWAGVPCLTYIMGFGPRDSTLQVAIQRRFDLYFPLSRVCDEYADSLGIPEAKRVIAYPGVDIEELRSRGYRSEAEIREELGVDDGKVLAIMVGNVRRWKGQDRVVEAVAGLEPELKERLTLFLVGDEGEKPDDLEFASEVRSGIERHGLGDVVRFTGRREDVPSLLEAAEIAVHASIFPEPFGLVVLEGMVHGCAVVATEGGGPSEMLTPESGMLWNPDEPSQLTAALERLLANPDVRAELAANARGRAPGFDVWEHVRTIENSYAEQIFD